MILLSAGMDSWWKMESRLIRFVNEIARFPMTEDLKTYICYNCAGNKNYKEFIKNNGEASKKCNYCKGRRTCIDIEKLADEVDDEYRNNYVPKEGGDPPEFIISELLEAEPDIADDLVSILSGRENRDVSQGADAYYDSDEFYGENDVVDFGNLVERQDEWQFFCYWIKHKKRFFNNDLIKYLDSNFSGLQNFKAGNKSPIRHIEPNDPDSTFYRARLVSPSEIQKIRSNSSIELGPPPENKARAGRMNPVGVSVFYGAFKPETCIAEIKGSVGDLAIVGQFKLKKPIRVLDLSILCTIDEPDYSSAGHIDELCGLYYFLRGFSSEIGKPVREIDSDLEYLPTQAITEYFAHNLRVDAVIYPSSQVSRREYNITILNHAVRIRGDDDDSCLSYVVGNDEMHRITAVSYETELV